ncbi:MAG: divergent PAP2 family protein [Candidatus Pacebacteria bacterium]|nr:divergent PAP2 family protein [Candidatus Paceibacterota bacterium]
MEFLNELFLNKALLAAVVAWFVAQSMKAFLLTFRNKKRKFRVNLYSLPGGFPSSHSATVSALATSVGIMAGFSSSIFAVAVILAFFIIYDAKVIRGAAGKQAQSLNKLIDVLDEDIDKLREILGHSLVEIFGGIMIGIIVGMMVTLS